MPWDVCQGYFCIAHIHVWGWSIVSSHKGVCLWNDIFWIWYIFLDLSLGSVMIWPCEFCKQSSELWVVGWNIFL